MKKVLVFGGSGALGKAVIKTFKTITPLWRTINIDFNLNKESDFSYVIKNNMNKEELHSLSKIEFINSNDKLDCVINVAGGWRGGSLEDEDVIENIDQMMGMNLYSSVMASHLAKKYLKEDSLFVLTGANAVKQDMNPMMIGYQLSKNSVHHLAELMVKSNYLPKNTKVITLLPGIIDTESNRKGMPEADFSEWTKPEAIAKLIKNWADSKDYPKENYFKV